MKQRAVLKAREIQVLTLCRQFGLPRHRARLLAEHFFGEVR